MTEEDDAKQRATSVLPEEPEQTKTKEDGRFFAHVRGRTGAIEPQLFVDAEMGKYQLTAPGNSFEVLAKHVLKLEDYDLSLDELAKKYPAPR